MQRIQRLNDMQSRLSEIEALRLKVIEKRCTCGLLRLTFALFITHRRTRSSDVRKRFVLRRYAKRRLLQNNSKPIDKLIWKLNSRGRLSDGTKKPKKDGDRSRPARAMWIAERN